MNTLLHPILADASSAWTLGTNIAICVASVAAVVIALVALNKTTDVKLKQPVAVTITEELHKVFADKQDLEKHIDDTKGEFDRVARERSDDLRVAAISRKTMYDKQDALRKDLSEHTDKVRKELSDKIDALPDRVIATLKNTGAI